MLKQITIVAMLMAALAVIPTEPAEAMPIKTVTGMCLDVRNGNFSDRSRLQTYTCNRSLAQHFFFPTEFSAATRPHNSSLAAYKGGRAWCIDMPYTHDGSPAWIFQCWGGENQRWEIADTALLLEDRWQFAMLPPAGNSQPIRTGNNALGVAAVTYTRNNELRLPDGRCLDVPWRTTDRTGVVAYACHGGANQKWYPSSNGIVGLGGMCLTAPTGTYGQMMIRPCTGSAEQRFRFGGRIRGPANKCLTSERNPRDWQAVFMRACDGSVEQYWTISPSDVSFNPLG